MCYLVWLIYGSQNRNVLGLAIKLNYMYTVLYATSLSTENIGMQKQPLRQAYEWCPSSEIWQIFQTIAYFYRRSVGMR